MTVRILHGDCRDVMATLPDCSVDAIVCDPPYDLTAGKKGGSGAASLNERSPAGRARIGTGFMGMKWDGTGVAFDPETWRQALRVLKPGGHLVAFGGTRTYHRMVCAVEDAGFEIRDQLGWLFGSGFPKSLDVSKAIDKAAGAEREVLGRSATHTTKAMNGGAFNANADREATQVMLTAPATEAARQWHGWGTALKPAWEPIVLARKPLVGTVAANVLGHGTGALNVDACRVEHDEECRLMAPSQANIERPSEKHRQAGRREATLELKPNGRWPANIVHDGSDEVMQAFPQSVSSNTLHPGTQRGSQFGQIVSSARTTGYSDGGSAARFFYCAKANATERAEGLHSVTSKGRNHHPTVKPTDLLRWLCRLVTPPGGTILDPFTGSGSTLKAAELEGFHAIGIELDAAYIEIARRRIAADAPLFAEVSA